MARSDPFSGARAVIKILTKEVGYAIDVSSTETIDRIPLIVLNNIQVKEFVPVGYNVSLRASMAYIIGGAPGIANDLKAENEGRSTHIFPHTIANAPAHLAEILSLTELELEIIDSYTGLLFRRAEGVDITAQNFQISARDLVLIDVEFTCKRIYAATDNIP